ncbi:hypothetical protein AB0Y04_02550 [Loigolactobacillus coryniformis]|uniref:Uncharacterized protein n=1 Tax=Loigolactobacillus coryniformis subsp. torquens DSM 20004 = KCTC 3535 TaxID=1423822 RepID=A0A2D1KMR1_9LACO|nr:hypothetical protein [Loigolactobacillus coryniformis]ATO43388.1 hypothetical protein LC20004_05465 [Loigolactobacillus coryniformis subsp. torquens DSM 20004 = KCTC 3535]KRK85490.1 hypothetical protein FC16_GL001444 [Loigolactobacillus coryniformis subsp. torquens DSM 20004 = KCTC 3535]MCL5457595.1 hypothetical protein [Loigolactobacillus coryniformis]MDN5951070.1 hypothetical protein [Loigolactobacillus coryniformis]MDN5953906.1 hypothetical protein [Loigolactobacillus coryniformis]
MNIALDDKGMEMLVDALADKLVDRMKPFVEELVAEEKNFDEILNQQELKQKIFKRIGNDNIAAVTAEQDFPKFYIGNNRTPSFSRKAVDKWIEEHQQYH